MKRMGTTEITLHAIRHGEAYVNRGDTYWGRSNESELTSEGVEQGRRLGRYFLRRGIEPDIIYSSIAARAVKTAEVCLDEMGIELDINTDEALQELDQGDWVGKVRADVKTE